MRIAVIGSNESSATPSMLEFAQQVGTFLVDQGHIIVNGGMGGTMAATARGAMDSPGWHQASVIGILPVVDETLGTDLAGVQIRTDMGSARNRLVIINGDAVLAIGGGSGTLNEMSYAWELGKPLAAYTEAGGWSARLAGTPLDNRRNDVVVPISSIEDLSRWIDKL